MGGFFLSNCERAVTRAKAFFDSIELPFDQRRLGSYQLLHLRKKHLDVQHWLETDQGRLAGIGTWLTERNFGAAALPEILASLASDRTLLQEVSGHFAFVADHGGQVSIVTDKTGTYPVYAASEGGFHHYSSSLLAIAEVLERTALNPQGLLEFIHMEAVLGSETLFQNIRALEFGAIVQVPASGEEREVSHRYYDARDRPVPLESVPEVLIEQVARLKHSGLGARDICCDLSGGYDSRTIAALLHRAAVPHLLNTNVNHSDPGDHAAALLAAEELQRPIVVYSFTRLDPKRGTLDYAFNRLDMARDVHHARITLAIFESKSSNHALLLGGYGGELLRDIYSNAANIRQTVAAYYPPSLRLPPARAEAYSARLREKFGQTLASSGFADDERASERIYFFEKMRVWGGSRIALYNRYAYGWHPLLDHRVQKCLLAVSLSDKANAKLQRDIIALDQELAEQPYTRAPKQVAAERRQQKSIRRYVERTQLFQRYKRARRALFPKRPRDLTLLPAGYAPIVAEFENLTGLSISQCTKREHRTRYLSLVDCFARYRGKFE